MRKRITTTLQPVLQYLQARRNQVTNILKLVLTVGLLALFLLLSRLDIRQTIAELVDADKLLLALALALYVGGIALRALRWQALLRAQAVEVPLKRLVVLYYIGSFFNVMLPTSVGGDAVRAYELARYSDSPGMAVGTVLVDRAIGLLMLLLMAALVLPFSLSLLPAWLVWLVLALAVGALVGMTLLLWGRPLLWAFHALPLRLRAALDRPAMHKLYRSFTGYDWRSLLVAAGVSLVFNLLLIAVNILIGLSVRIHIRLDYYAVLTSIISAVSALPISIGGLGVREPTYKMLFGLAGVKDTVAVAMSWAFYLINVLSGIIGGVMYAWEGARDAWRPGQEVLR